jgi:hypothetical protein
MINLSSPDGVVTSCRNEGTSLRGGHTKPIELKNPTAPDTGPWYTTRLWYSTAAHKPSQQLTRPGQHMRTSANRPAYTTPCPPPPPTRLQSWARDTNAILIAAQTHPSDRRHRSSKRSYTCDNSTWQKYGSGCTANMAPVSQ